MHRIMPEGEVLKVKKDQIKRGKIKKISR